MAGRLDYKERKERKKDIYQQRSLKAERNSQTYYNWHNAIARNIPMGQPILVGHHSEKRHRKDLERIDNAMSKSIEENDKANFYRDKIETIDNNKTIFSDDPNAIEKLEEKLKLLEEQKVKIKARKHEWYELPYVNTDIKRIKNRISEIKALDELDIDDVFFDGGKLIINKEINRVQFIFDFVPNEEVRTLLKGRGFKWSKYEKAWQRILTTNALTVSKWILDDIRNLGAVV